MDRGDPAHLREELGDLLLNIFLQARIAEELGQFTLADVATGISDKLVRRHPHVFGNDTAVDSAAVRKRWDEIKRAEKGEDPEVRRSALRALPASLPALTRAERMGRMAAEVGFDWADADGPWAKVKEELAELGEARAGADPGRIEAELGDLLFAITSLARHLAIDSERALTGALDRFRARFRHLEPNLTDADGVRLSASALDELWNHAKRAEARAAGEGAGTSVHPPAQTDADRHTASRFPGTISPRGTPETAADTD